jgi:hypothetical protein
MRWSGKPHNHFRRHDGENILFANQDEGSSKSGTSWRIEHSQTGMLFQVQMEFPL